MTIRQINLTHKIAKLEAMESLTESQARELSEARTALGYASAPIRESAITIRSGFGFAPVNDEGDINNLLRRNGNTAAAE